MYAKSVSDSPQSISKRPSTHLPVAVVTETITKFGGFIEMNGITLTLHCLGSLNFWNNACTKILLVRASHGILPTSTPANLLSSVLITFSTFLRLNSSILKCNCSVFFDEVKHFLQMSVFCVQRLNFLVRFSNLLVNSVKLWLKWLWLLHGLCF